MKKSRFTDTQVVAVLKEADAGMAVKEVCRLPTADRGSTLPGHER